MNSTKMVNPKLLKVHYFTSRKSQILTKKTKNYKIINFDHVVSSSVKVSVNRQ